MGRSSSRLRKLRGHGTGRLANSGQPCSWRLHWPSEKPRQIRGVAQLGRAGLIGTSGTASPWWPKLRSHFGETATCKGNRLHRQGSGCSRARRTSHRHQPCSSPGTGTHRVRGKGWSRAMPPGWYRSVANIPAYEIRQCALFQAGGAVRFEAVDEPLATAGSWRNAADTWCTRPAVPMNRPQGDVT
jgi:hypothetical protein